MPSLNLTELSVRALKGSDSYITYWDTGTPGFGVRVGKTLEDLDRHAGQEPGA